MTTFIALLCGINVGGNRKVPMADLRALAGTLGFKDARTYIASGNLVFSASGTAKATEVKLEKPLHATFGFAVDVLVRTASEWHAYTKGNPFPEASEAEPNRVMLCLSKSPPKPDAATALSPRAANGERVELSHGALWIHYAEGAGKSKLSPALLDRLVGSKVTARNWRTVLELGTMAGA